MAGPITVRLLDLRSNLDFLLGLVVGRASSALHHGPRGSAPHPARIWGTVDRWSHGKAFGPAQWAHIQPREANSDACRGACLLSPMRKWLHCVLEEAQSRGLVSQQCPE